MEANILNQRIHEGLAVQKSGSGIAAKAASDV
jgi:hypothetical protein